MSVPNPPYINYNITSLPPIIVRRIIFFMILTYNTLISLKTLKNLSHIIVALSTIKAPHIPHWNFKVLKTRHENKISDTQPKERP